MEKVELEKLIERWRKGKELLEALEKAIKNEVIKQKKSMTHNDVKITYSKPRTTYDYKLAAIINKAPEDIVSSNTEPKVNWKGVCIDSGFTEEDMSDFKSVAENGNANLKIIGDK